MSSHKQNRFQPSVEQLEQRDVPSATLGAIPGLATAAVNSDFNAHVISALDKAVHRQMPPAGDYPAVGNAADVWVVTIFDSTTAPSSPVDPDTGEPEIRAGYDLKMNVKK